MSAEKDSQGGSCSLQIIHEKSSDVVNETYADSGGKETYAADKYYARITKTRQRNTPMEESFDEDGNPANKQTEYSGLRDTTVRG